MRCSVVFSASLLLVIAACADGNSPVEPPLAQDLPVSGVQAVQVVDGSTGPGALYRLVVPPNWNGTLLLYAHGYVSPRAPVELPAEAEQLAALLGAQGVALAYSSFSENGWAVKDGTQRTHQLLGLFTSKFGSPGRVYVGGASMGGLIAIKLTERYPRTYDGTLAACAVAGGAQKLADYHAHVRAVFDVLYPGVLPGNAAELPPGTDIAADIIAPAVAAMTVNPVPALTLAALDQTPVPFASAPELVESIVTALAANAGDLTDVLITRGAPYFDNSTTVYSSSVLPPAVVVGINAAVARFEAAPDVLAALAHNYTPTGELEIPMVMLSNVRDPVVPGFNQSSYLSAVTDAGTADLLVQREVPVYGHCVFTPAELGGAFAELVGWVEYGVKPAP